MTLEKSFKTFIGVPLLFISAAGGGYALTMLTYHAVKKHGAELRYCAYHYPDVDPEDCVTMNLIERIRGKRNEEKARMKK
jgi:hypothetical protein